MDDGWDPDFLTPYDAQVDAQVAQDLAWSVRVYSVADSLGGHSYWACGGIIDALLQIEAELKAALIDAPTAAISKMPAVATGNASGMVEAFHGASEQFNSLQAILGVLADAMINNNVNAVDPDSGWMAFIGRAGQDGHFRLPPAQRGGCNERSRKNNLSQFGRNDGN